MPLTRKQQILAKLETSEGTNSNPGAGDAILVYEPGVQDEVDTQDRVPAGATLSRDFVPIGRKRRTVTFQSDFRGSADTSIPVTVPEWGTLLTASAFKSVAPVKLPVTSLTGGYQVGEIVQKSANIRGVVLGCFAGGSTLTHRLTVNGDVIVAPLEGTFTTGGTLTGESSGATGTIGTVAAYAGLNYQPTSEKLINTTNGGFAPGSPSVGDIATIKTGSIVVGHCQLAANNGGWTDVDVVLLWGSISNGDTLTVGANSATINAVPSMKRTPSLTIRTNLDGFRKDAVGARGDFQLQGEAGGPMIFSWTFTGDPVAGVDAVPATTSGLGTIRPPRLLGAICVYGRVDAAEFYRLPTKSVGYSAGNAINPNLDANSAGGSTGANVSDRDPSLTLTVDQVHSGFDWASFRDNSTAIRVAIIAGTTAGEIVGFVAPNCQVLEAAGGDADGVATFDLNLRPRRVLEGGDDEAYFFQL